ncbi:glycosyltransferase family 4 protein [Patescibacteria group bacterium AH-259-L05]|nr:glycosyltransferase family 4 protein [Patescibacteria group bacterium AH-259-L05]
MTKKIKVLMLLDNIGIGGQQNYAILIAEKLDKSRFDCIVGYAIDGSWRQRIINADLGLLKYAETDQILKRLTSFKVPIIKPWICINPIYRVIKFIREEKIDIVHTNGIFSYIVGVSAARIAGIPSIRTPGCTMQSYERLHYKIFKLLPFTYWVTKFIALLKTIKDELVKRGINEDKIRYIPHGIDLNKFNPDISGEKIRKEFNININTPVIGKIARIVSSMRFDLFLEAATIVLPKIPEAKFMIVGDGPSKNKLIKMAQRLNISDSVIFTGFRSDIPEIIAALDISVETMDDPVGGMATLESMAEAKSVIATEGKSQGMREFIDNNQTGIIIPPKNPEALAKAIIKLIKDKERAQEMGQRARKKAEKEFDFNDHVKKTQELYLELYYSNKKK